MAAGVQSRALPLAAGRPAPVARRRIAARSEPLLFLCALSLTAAAVHAVAAVPHMAEYPRYGVLFGLLATVQAGTGIVAYRRPDRRLLMAMALLNGVVVIVWVLSRTAGLPLGPDGPGVPERIGVADALTTVDELAGIALAVGLARVGALTLTPRLRAALITVLILAGIGACAVGHTH